MVGDTPELARGFGVAVAWLLFSCLNPRTGGGRKSCSPNPRRQEKDELMVGFFSLGACYYDANQSMYVFGGCTQSSCNAAFNDLWRLDLNSKEWIRPLASGEGQRPAAFPSPSPTALLLKPSSDLTCRAAWSQSVFSHMFYH